MTDTAKVIPINKTREPVTGHLNNALQMANWFIDDFGNMSDEAVGATALKDITAIRDRIVAALAVITEVKASLVDAKIMTQNGRRLAIARIKICL